MRKSLRCWPVACLALIFAACSSGGDNDIPTPGAASAPRTATPLPVARSSSPTPGRTTAAASPSTPAAISSRPPSTSTPAATTSTDGQQPPAAPATPTPAPAGPVTLTVHAKDQLFDVSELHARAGQQVTAVFVNEDEGVTHNLGFSLPGLPHGETCAGPCTLSQTFPAGAPGTYSFFCTIHATMFGTFIVDP